MSTNISNRVQGSETTEQDLDTVLHNAAAAAGPLAEQRPEDRAAMLRSIATTLEDAGDELIQLAIEETHLSEPRLTGELRRTTFQLRLFADEVLHGKDVRIDPSDPEWPMGPRPDLRRTQIPLGPVLVFAASNFPFAFSVPGGDTASALAAGCPVVVKAHPGHPELSARVSECIHLALEKVGAPTGTFAVIYGREAGVTALKDSRIQAGAFTGSIGGGRALFDIANQRPQPIPFFGELGSNNPVFVTRKAAAERAEEIAKEYIEAVTGSAGQLCTKPGTLFVPSGAGITEAISQMQLPGAVPLLMPRMEEDFIQGIQQLTSSPELEVIAGVVTSDKAAPVIVKTSMKHFLNNSELRDEQFGPYSLVVEYEDESDLLPALESFEGQLTGSIHGTDDDSPNDLVDALVHKCGRVLWNSWPTGVSVTYAQQHGGPYPATTAVQTTSVGTAAMHRFLRPVTYQGFPSRLLPTELREI